MTDHPDSDRFRERGQSMTRVETFADAAFAFAVTLLVVGGGDSIPGSFDEMIAALQQVPAFAASFANIMIFWVAHHRWSRRYGLNDTISLLLSLLLVFVVLIFVYPLKAIFSGAFHFFSGGYLESYFALQSIDDLRTMFVIFGAGFAAMSTVMLLLNRHALAQQASLALSPLEVFDTVTEIQNWQINAVVPLLSIGLALLLPDNLVVAAGMFYAVFGITGFWHRWRRGPQRETLLGG